MMTNNEVDTQKICERCDLQGRIQYCWGPSCPARYIIENGPIKESISDNG